MTGFAQLPQRPRGTSHPLLWRGCAKDAAPVVRFDSRFPHLSGRQLPTTSQLLEGSRVATCSTMMNVQKEIPNSGFLWIPKIAHFPASKKKSAVSPGVSDLKLKPLVDSIWFLPLAYTVIVIFHQPQYCRNVSRIPVISSRFNNKKPFGIISFFRIFEITTIWQLPRKA